MNELLLREPASEEQKRWRDWAHWAVSLEGLLCGQSTQKRGEFSGGENSRENVIRLLT